MSGLCRPLHRIKSSVASRCPVNSPQASKGRTTIHITYPHTEENWWGLLRLSPTSPWGKRSHQGGEALSHLDPTRGRRHGPESSQIRKDLRPNNVYLTNLPRFPACWNEISSRFLLRTSTTTSGLSWFETIRRESPFSDLAAPIWAHDQMAPSNQD